VLSVTAKWALPAFFIFDGAKCVVQLNRIAIRS